MQSNSSRPRSRSQAQRVQTSCTCDGGENEHSSRRIAFCTPPLSRSTRSGLETDEGASNCPQAAARDPRTPSRSQPGKGSWSRA
eukprot:10528991-Alexandrium_andersonii.AAC.1